MRQACAPCLPLRSSAFLPYSPHRETSELVPPGELLLDAVPARLNLPPLEALTAVTRASCARQVLGLIYLSLN